MNTNRIQLKAFLLETITLEKFGNVMGNLSVYRAMKKRYCEEKGISHNIKAMTLLGHIGATYEDNGLRSDFDATMNRFGYNVNN